MTKATKTAEQRSGAMSLRAAFHRYAAIVADANSAEAQREKARVDLRLAAQVQAAFVKPLDPLARLQAKYVVDESGCWLWTGTITAKGYGVLNFKRRNVHAHRVSYELHVGTIPADKEIDHLCRVRSCVNPSHLEAIPHAENIRRASRLRTHCSRGHAYAEHAWVRRNQKTGGEWRMCRICRNEKDKRARLRKAGSL